MNDQLPPIDSDIREQLTRRSAGRMPEGLLAEVSNAIDAIPMERPRRMRLAAPTAWRSPRFAAAASIALIAVLGVALIAVPAFRTQPGLSPAGYPADRALTTAELAALLAGPELAVNTTLVASVTIEARTDVCPMNSRPTIGVVAGIGSQVCVMGSSISEYLKQTAGTGTFAFRYMARGYLGLIGEIAPASAARLAFHVADEWPLTVKAFLVDAYLGATALECDATQTFEVGDYLNPSGYEPCRSSWLSDDGSPAPVIENRAGSVSSAETAGPAETGGPTASPAPSVDLLALHGKARYVTAGGARQIDSIPLETTHGVYVIRPTTGPCPGASPVDSRGCVTWQVLAKVADISVPAPTASQSAAPSSALAGYPAERALTTAELAELMAGPALPVSTALVASVTIDAKTDVCPMNRAPTIGVIEGMHSQVCAMGAGVSDYLKTDKVSGTFAFQYWAPGVLGLLGAVTPASSSRLAFHVGETWPTADSILVDGWLQRSNVVGTDPLACPAQTPDSSSNFSCITFWLSVSANGSGPGAITVVMSTLTQTAPNGRGVFLLTPDSSRCPDASAGDEGSCLFWRIEARIPEDPAGVTTSTTEPPATPVAAPTPTPSPSPLILPTGPAGAAPIGLIGSGNRPLTEGEFATLWAADPAHLAGRFVVVKGPVPTGFFCWDAGAADAAMSSPGCHIAISDGQIADDGHYWVVQVGAGGKLGVVGELSTPQSSFVFDPLAVAAGSVQSGSLVVVEANLIRYWPGPCGTTDEPRASACGPFEALSSESTDNAEGLITLPSGTYRSVTGTAGEPYTYGPPVHGLFLVRMQAYPWGSVLAELQTVPVGS